MGIARSTYIFYDDTTQSSKTDSSDYDFETFSDIKGEGVFYHYGQKSITLKITLKSGKIVTDTVSI